MSFSEQKKKLLEALLQEEGVASRREDRIRRRSNPNRAPLSFAQERVWLFDQLLPGTSVYNIPAVVRLRGPLNQAVLRSSLAEIVRRHETLRTSFVKSDTGPVAVISENPAVTIEIRDLTALPESQREREALSLANSEARAPFVLSQAPLFRANLIRLADEDHFFVLTVHHIVAEGWSLAILFRELEILYAAFLDGRPSPLAQLPVQFGDYASWQRESLTDAFLADHVAYWKQQLQNLPVLHLPVDYARPAVQTFRGAWRSATYSAELSAALKSLSQSEGATLYMTLLAAFATLLYRYTGQDDVAIGSPIAGRNHSETENLIGFFVNTLVMRVNASEDPSFRELLRRVRAVALDAYAHQDVPFEKLVHEINPSRDMSRTALFQVMFALQNTPMPALKLAGIQPVEPLTPSEVHDAGAKTDLTLIIEERSDGLAAGFEYSADLFSEATMDRMLRHMGVLLQSIVVDPDRKISTIPILAEAERRQLLVEWNDTTTSYPRDRRVDEMFQRQAESSPDSIAVIDGGRSITYRELNQRSNQLAHHLKRFGAGAGVLVAICVSRSIDMVAGLLGILKTGAGYVPLDPEYPQQRLAVMVEEAKVSILVTEEPLLDTFDTKGLQVICIDSHWPAIALEPVMTPPSEGTAEDIAYLMYTSGSTGRPKGIGIPHRAIHRLVFNTNYVVLGPSSRIAQLSNTSFDASTFEIWGALLHGGRLFIIPKDVSLTPVRLVEALKAHQITSMFLTTSLFNQTAREVPSGFATVHDVMLGGEAVDPRWVRIVLRNGKPPRLMNVYGPTESTTFAAFYPIEHVGENDRSIPIGRPLANTTLFVLDKNLQPVPVGVPGELYIGGDGLACGYFNDAELTAQKFVPNPFSADSDARLYRTGDLVQWNAEGNVEFLQRIDHQIKIRGFRVELGEVESVVRQHPAVRDCVVIVREDIPGDKRLAAYVVASDDQPVDAFRRFVSERLPDFMVPALFVRIDTLPLNPNGKVDHKALPAPAGIRPELEAAFVIARTDIERNIASAWQDVLRLDKVGVDDNFFDLGGNSLLVAQVHSRLSKIVDKPVAMLELFKYPTIRSLANFIGSSAESAMSNQGDGRGNTRRQFTQVYKQRRTTMARTASDDGRERE